MIRFYGRLNRRGPHDASSGNSAESSGARKRKPGNW
jgi:hypothetical protein